MNGSECVLLTGPSGFFGGYLLRQLSSRAAGKILCLVRGNSREAAQARLTRALVRHGHRQLIEQVGEKIHVIPGDLAKPDLGMAGTDWALVARACDYIIHNGAETNLTKSVEKLRGVNVDPVRSLLRLARNERTRPIAYISSYSVLLSDEFASRSRIGENELPTNPMSLDSGYQQSKLEAELILREARRSGVPVTVFRPDLLVGDSVTGHWPFGDLVTIMIRIAFELGRAPRSNARVGCLPVDIAAEAVVSALMNERHLNRDFNVVPASTYTYSDVFALFRGTRYELEFAAPDRWLADCRTCSVGDPVVSALMPLLSRMLGKSATGRKYKLEIDNSNLSRLLGAQAGRLDWLRRDIVLRYVDRLVATGRIRRPVRTPAAVPALT